MVDCIVVSRRIKLLPLVTPPGKKSHSIIFVIHLLLIFNFRSSKSNEFVGKVFIKLQMEIRKATFNDFEKILSLNKDLFLFEKKFTDTFNEDWSYTNQGKEYFARKIANSNSIFFVAEIDENIVGYILGYIDSYPVRNINPIVMLDNLFISENYRRKGIGSKLFQEFLKVAKDNGAKRLQVKTYSKNKEAIEFYKKQGFYELELVMEHDL